MQGFVHNKYVFLIFLSTHSCKNPKPLKRRKFFLKEIFTKKHEPGGEAEGSP